MNPTKSPFNWWLILGVVLGIVGVAIILRLSFPRKLNQTKDEWLPRLPLATKSGETISIRLYFGSRASPRLAVETREVAKLSPLTDQASEIISQLLEGPKTKELAATIPKGTSLREIYIDQAGCAYVDFSSHIRQHHPGGSYAELQTIYSVVNTLTSNLEPVKRVKILVDGAEIDTLVGHIDTRYPLAKQEL